MNFGETQRASFVFQPKNYIMENNMFSKKQQLFFILVEKSLMPKVYFANK